MQEAWIPIPEGCRLGLDHLECSQEAVEELRGVLCGGSGRGRECIEARAEAEALRELLEMLVPQLERLRVEVEGVEREARLPEEVRRRLEDALAAARRIRSLLAQLEGRIGAWLCYAVVPHEEPNSRGREKLSPRLRARIKTAREAFASRLEQIPGVKLASKGFVYLYFREEDARRFQEAYARIVEPVRRLLEERGYQTLSAAACRKILVALDDAVDILRSEIERLEQEARRLQLEILGKRLEGRDPKHLQSRLKRLRSRLEGLRAILHRVQAAARRVEPNA